MTSLPPSASPSSPPTSLPLPLPRLFHPPTRPSFTGSLSLSHYIHPYYLLPPLLPPLFFYLRYVFFPRHSFSQSPSITLLSFSMESHIHTIFCLLILLLSKLRYSYSVDAVLYEVYRHTELLLIILSFLVDYRFGVGISLIGIMFMSISQPLYVGKTNVIKMGMVEFYAMVLKFGNVTSERKDAEKEKHSQSPSLSSSDNDVVESSSLSSTSSSPSSPLNLFSDPSYYLVLFLHSRHRKSLHFLSHFHSLSLSHSTQFSNFYFILFDLTPYTALHGHTSLRNFLHNDLQITDISANSNDLPCLALFQYGKVVQNGRFPTLKMLDIYGPSNVYLHKKNVSAFYFSGMEKSAENKEERSNQNHNDKNKGKDVNASISSSGKDDQVNLSAQSGPSKEKMN